MINLEKWFFPSSSLIECCGSHHYFQRYEMVLRSIWPRIIKVKLIQINSNSVHEAIHLPWDRPKNIRTTITHRKKTSYHTLNQNPVPSVPLILPQLDSTSLAIISLAIQSQLKCQPHIHFICTQMVNYLNSAHITCPIFVFLPHITHVQ